MTKTAQIMRLKSLGLSTREIADRVGCLTAYVRVVANQRFGKGQSAADIRYLDSPRGKEKQRASKKRYRQSEKGRRVMAAAQARYYRRRKGLPEYTGSP